MNGKRVELLAPAGNYDSFLAAIQAGADAVYLGGEKFGARAFADNFSQEELCRAIQYAHVFDRKVYLTLNTLVKEKEFSELFSYLAPFYKEGLDGVIVQDMGVLKYVREVFPELPVHISTQAMVTGVEGARFFKNLGAGRIVPARELSLAEIAKIREEVDIELETFIHGAMCYCYSGQCLFSSIVGGRSGNRGRCAQPCRLPYKVSCDNRLYLKDEAYPLSLKDMCTIQDIPRLIEAGIDSFKIEGRMKKPEYVAGVTAVYRKYIDLYYKNPSGYSVKKEDINVLSNLYIRSEIQNGYYFKHNGKEMITLKSPAYSGSDEKLLSRIREQYLNHGLKLKVKMFLYCHVSEKISLAVSYGKLTVKVSGNVVDAAETRPLNEPELEKRISKTGNTCFEVEKANIDLCGDCFVPVKELNDLRREALGQLKDAILKQKSDRLRRIEPDSEGYAVSSPKEKETAENVQKGFSVLVSTPEQLEVSAKYADFISRFYIDSDLYISYSSHLPEDLKKTGIFLALPYVIRDRDQSCLEKVLEILRTGEIDGLLIRNFEELGWAEQCGIDRLKIAFDAGMYMFNRYAVDFYGALFHEERNEMTFAFPWELNFPEKKELQENAGNRLFEQIVYGRIPMMVTANCLRKTVGCCNHRPGYAKLIDRYSHSFPVETVCSHCYNIIWNCVPLSLHSKIRDYSGILKRIMFTVENAEEVEKILSCFLKGSSDFPFREYTKGHEKRGVE